MTETIRPFWAFWDEHDVQPNHLDPNASLGIDDVGYMYETYGEELEYVRSVYAEAPGRVWTYMSGDEGYTITPGLWHVNRLGYLITKDSYTGPDVDYFDPLEDDDA